ncbi:MAG: Asp-tRNA(Asn)/Glu-tRNA(Gln) amidotransferase subunit GatB [Candidatus Omnitrophica bacterium]|nr:Asp-tRNA(Asn)/Glu-tRNA(Gln) amidotransferase subunit GatB [Candidatus Omnitrophota bacterium]
MSYESVIGLEVHVQLATDSKLFCGCPTKFGAPPNTQTCPVCLGLPGVLPVLNERAFEWGIKTALAFGCEIASVMKFDRKQYYYPDLPKNYQISQYDQPLAQHGRLVIEPDGRSKTIQIRRIHLEEDAGKLIHDTPGAFSCVDFNRTGVALLEIVSEPDLRSPEEAHEYLTELKTIVQYLKISTCNMEEGSLRCDANISIRPAGSDALGVKVEIKNLNSFKAVKDSLAHEAQRQARALEGGQRIIQETRLWNVKSQTTESMRSKEEASDYRYFPEPDLVPFLINRQRVEAVAKTLPELPAHRRLRFGQQYGLAAYDAHVLTQVGALADLFEAVTAQYAKPKPVANWVMGELLGYLNAQGTTLDSLRVDPRWIVHTLQAIDNGTISGKMAKELFAEAIQTQRDPEAIIQDRGLRQIVDIDELRRLADQVLAANPDSVQAYRNGKANALMFLVGQCMRQSQGKANPQQITEILRHKLAAGKEVVT